jgi:hypothetical protein
LLETESALKDCVEDKAPGVETAGEDDDVVNELDMGKEYWLVEDEAVEDGLLLNDDKDEEVKSDENDEDELMDICVLEELGSIELCPVEVL